MSRHRIIRNMDYFEDYEGYDDVYDDNSSDDDYYISPCHRQYMLNAENSDNFGYPLEEDIEEEDEIDQEFELCDEDRAKLESCLQHVESAFAPIRLSRQEKVKIIIGHKFDIEKIVDSILKSEGSHSIRRINKDETNLLFKSNQACCTSANRNKSYTASQKVESQSEVNLLMLNGRNSSQFKNNTDSLGVGRSLFSVGHCPSRSDSSNDCKENAEDLTISFLSKMKNKNDITKTAGPASPAASFLSRMKLHSKEVDVKENQSPEISFLSRISKHQKEPHRDETSSDISRNNSNVKSVDLNNFMTNSTQIIESSKNFKIGNSPLRFKFGTEAGKDSLASAKISHDFTSKVPLNGMKNTVNDKLGSFLGRIGSKQTFNSMEHTKSDISFVIKKSLPKDFSKLKLKETKSMSSLDKSTSDDSSNINLITALQKGHFENLKFRPASSEEQFDIPFVDCEYDETLDDGKQKLLECTMNLSHLATKTLPYCKKRPSQLGRIICLKYRIPKAKKIKREKMKLDPRLVIFDFLEPSPDDQIKKHIRRNL